MQRREYLAGGLGLAAVLAGGAYVTLGEQGSGQVEPTEVPLLDAPEATGSLTVPAPGTYTVLDLFSYTCLACPPQMENLRQAKLAVGDRAQFVSIHPVSLVEDREEPTNVLEFWDEHGAPWPMGLDPEDHFHTAFDQPSHPFTAVIDPEGTVLWSETGKTPPSDIEAAIPEEEA